MTEYVIFIVGTSVGFVVGAAWGSAFTRMRLTRFMYKHPDVGEAVLRAARRSRS